MKTNDFQQELLDFAQKTIKGEMGKPFVTLLVNGVLICGRIPLLADVSQGAKSGQGKGQNTAQILLHDVRVYQGGMTIHMRSEFTAVNLADVSAWFVGEDPPKPG